MVDGLQVQVMRDETELESARRARDSILANISHEFRTPLAAQLASLELLEDNLAGDAARAAPRAGRARCSAARCASRGSSTTCSRACASSPASSASARSRVALEDVVREAGELVEGLLAQRGQSLEVALPDDLPDVVGDAPRLTQVFVNLLANANKFGPDGGTIRIGGELAGAEVARLGRGRGSRRCRSRAGLDLRALLPRGGPGARAARPGSRAVDRQVHRRAARRPRRGRAHAGRPHAVHRHAARGRSRQ